MTALRDRPGGISSIRPALLQERVGEKVRCLTCERRCLLKPGDLGWCRTRRNDDGHLVTLTYGSISSLSANPIEKKPLYHFHPGTTALTCGSWSCNLNCPWCQNWNISKSPPPEGTRESTSPAAFVHMARRFGCQGTSISLNEPTLSLEWSLEVFGLAREQDLYNTFVTNGYMTSQALELLIDAGMDAANVDLKGTTETVQEYCGIDVEMVWRNTGRMRELGVWVEVTTLIIPTVNDDAASLVEIAQHIATRLGKEVPWHVNAYYPAYRFDAPQTPVQSLERAWHIGKEAGLEYVYVGNVLGHPRQHTRCPSCDTLLLERSGLSVKEIHLKTHQCPRCGKTIAGVW
jgi:pyruvate formate lyase activating enzyme